MMPDAMPTPPRKPAPERVNKPKTVTLTPDARKALAALEERAGNGSGSAETSAAIIERADRLVPEWREK
jgi:hypothetical protein